MIQPSIHRRTLLKGAAASLLSAPLLARAQDAFPSKPIRIIVPLPAGGAADVSARILAEYMQAELKQPVVVDNKPGGLYMIGLQTLAGAPADGYTLLHTNASMCAVQVTQRQFDMARQMAQVGTIGATDMVLFASNTAPFKTIPEMLAWAKANPDKLSYASQGAGSVEHLTMVTMGMKNGFSGTNVPFKGGPDGMLALAQGEIHLAPTALPLYFQFKDRVRPLAVNRLTRSPSLPDVPTLKELGIDIPPVNYWGGLAALPGTPQPVMAALQKALAASVAHPALRQRYVPIGLSPYFMNGEETSKQIAAELAWMGEAAKAAKLA